MLNCHNKNNSNNNNNKDDADDDDDDDDDSNNNNNNNNNNIWSIIYITCSLTFLATCSWLVCICQFKDACRGLLSNRQ